MSKDILQKGILRNQKHLNRDKVAPMSKDISPLHQSYKYWDSEDVLNWLSYPVMGLLSFPGFFTNAKAIKDGSRLKVMKDT